MAYLFLPKQHNFDFGKPLSPMTPEQEVKQEFRNAGMSVTEWATTNGFKPSLVYAVLSGQRKCYRGKSHEIAIALGLITNKQTKD